MVTATDVADALTRRWPDDAYLHIREAPDGPSRQGRKIDVLVVSLWQSRGYELDAVEIKVSVSDWRRELQKPQKADWWWKHANRFWIAAPAEVAAKIKDELPSGWGLLALNGSGMRVAMQPEKHQASPLSWPQTIGLLRAAADSGFGALNRASAAGYRRGVEDTEKRLHGQSADGRAERDLERLRSTVDEFENASGVSIAQGWRAGEIGTAVAHVLDQAAHPGRTATRLAHLAAELDRHSSSIAALSEILGGLPESEESR